MRPFLPLVALLVLAAPFASAHGALELNEFDTYAISDFEGHEDSFPWEGFEIWDIYAGDGYLSAMDSHGVYFKGNFAGDGTLRPSGSQEWTLEFTFDVGDSSYARTIVHDGTDVTSDFEQLEWQIADGNVFQVHAWVPVPAWDGLAITNLVVVSSVDGNPRDIAPGGFYDPATGQEVPFAAPSTVVFPPMGEGRIVESVPLTGAQKFLDVQVSDEDGAFTFSVTNALASQGQHFMVAAEAAGWTIDGLPAAQSLEGGADTAFTLRFAHATEGIVEPLRVDLQTDIGGLQSWYAFADEAGIQVVDDAALATSHAIEAPKTTPGPSLLLVAAGLLLARRRQ